MARGGAAGTRAAAGGVSHVFLAGMLLVGMCIGMFVGILAVTGTKAGMASSFRMGLAKITGGGGDVGLAPDMQLGREQVDAALEGLDRASRAAGRPPRMLMFSLGNDSPMWYHEVVDKRKGEIAFIENNRDWWTKVVGDHPQLRAVSHMVAYSTQVREVLSWFVPPAEGGDWGADRWCSEFPIRDLPAAVTEVAWDVVFVDAPWGFKFEHPGRFQSVFEAARLVARSGAGGRVLVDDCGREAENKAAQALLGLDPQFVRGVGRHGEDTPALYPGDKAHLHRGKSRDPAKVKHYFDEVKVPNGPINMVCVFDFKGDTVPPAVLKCGDHSGAAPEDGEDASAH